MRCCRHHAGKQGCLQTVSTAITLLGPALIGIPECLGCYGLPFLGLIAGSLLYLHRDTEKAEWEVYISTLLTKEGVRWCYITA